MSSEINKVDVATFLVDNAGNITGSHNRNPGECIVVNNQPRETYDGKIYANHKGHDGTRQLVGVREMTVGTIYAIHANASGKDYMITTTRPEETGAADPASEPAHERLRRGGGNGDLYVGSTGNDRGSGNGPPGTGHR